MMRQQQQGGGGRESGASLVEVAYASDVAEVVVAAAAAAPAVSAAASEELAAVMAPTTTRPSGVMESSTTTQAMAADAAVVATVMDAEVTAVTPSTDATTSEAAAVASEDSFVTADVTAATTTAEVIVTPTTAAAAVTLDTEELLQQQEQQLQQVQAQATADALEEAQEQEAARIQAEVQDEARRLVEQEEADAERIVTEQLELARMLVEKEDGDAAAAAVTVTAGATGVVQPMELLSVGEQAAEVGKVRDDVIDVEVVTATGSTDGGGGNGVSHPVVAAAGLAAAAAVAASGPTTAGPSSDMTSAPTTAYEKWQQSQFRKKSGDTAGAAASVLYSNPMGNVEGWLKEQAQKTEDARTALKSAEENGPRRADSTTPLAQIRFTKPDSETELVAETVTTSTTSRSQSGGTSRGNEGAITVEAELVTSPVKETERAPTLFQYMQKTIKDTAVTVDKQLLPKVIENGRAVMETVNTKVVPEVIHGGQAAVETGKRAAETLNERLPELIESGRRVADMVGNAGQKAVETGRHVVEAVDERMPEIIAGGQKVVETAGNAGRQVVQLGRQVGEKIPGIVEAGQHLLEDEDEAKKVAAGVAIAGVTVVASAVAVSQTNSQQRDDAVGGYAKDDPSPRGHNTLGGLFTTNNATGISDTSKGYPSLTTAKSKEPNPAGDQNSMFGKSKAVNPAPRSPGTFPSYASIASPKKPTPSGGWPSSSAKPFPGPPKPTNLRGDDTSPPTKLTTPSAGASMNGTQTGYSKSAFAAPVVKRTTPGPFGSTSSQPPLSKSTTETTGASMNQSGNAFADKAFPVSTKVTSTVSTVDSPTRNPKSTQKPVNAYSKLASSFAASYSSVSTPKSRKEPSSASTNDKQQPIGGQGVGANPTKSFFTDASGSATPNPKIVAAFSKPSQSISSSWSASSAKASGPKTVPPFSKTSPSDAPVAVGSDVSEKKDDKPRASATSAFFTEKSRSGYSILTKKPEGRNDEGGIKALYDAIQVEKKKQNDGMVKQQPPTTATNTNSGWSTLAKKTAQIPSNPSSSSSTVQDGTLTGGPKKNDKSLTPKGTDKTALFNKSFVASYSSISKQSLAARKSQVETSSNPTTNENQGSFTYELRPVKFSTPAGSPFGTLGRIEEDKVDVKTTPNAATTDGALGTSRFGTPSDGKRGTISPLSTTSTPSKPNLDPFVPTLEPVAPSIGYGSFSKKPESVSTPNMSRNTTISSSSWTSSPQATKPSNPWTSANGAASNTPTTKSNESGAPPSPKFGGPGFGVPSPKPMGTTSGFGIAASKFNGTAVNGFGFPAPKFNGTANVQKGNGNAVFGGLQPKAYGNSNGFGIPPPSSSSTSTSTAGYGIPGPGKKATTGSSTADAASKQPTGEDTTDVTKKSYSPFGGAKKSWAPPGSTTSTGDGTSTPP